VAAPSGNIPTPARQGQPAFVKESTKGVAGGLVVALSGFETLVNLIVEFGHHRFYYFHFCGKDC